MSDFFFFLQPVNQLWLQGFVDSLEPSHVPKLVHSLFRPIVKGVQYIVATSPGAIIGPNQVPRGVSLFAGSICPYLECCIAIQAGAGGKGETLLPWNPSFIAQAARPLDGPTSQVQGLNGITVANAIRGKCPFVLYVLS